jgi:hypothetical protein
MDLKFQIGLIALTFLGACLPSQRVSFFIFFLSFMAPVGLDIYAFPPRTEFAHLGKALEEFRLFFVDCTLLTYFFSQWLHSNKQRTVETRARAPKDIFLIFIYVLFGFLSIYWAVNKAAGLCEMINQLKLFCVLIYLTSHYEWIVDNLHLISKAFLVLVLVQLSFCIMQIISGQSLMISNLLGYNAIVEEAEVRFGFIRPYGSVGVLLSTLMGIAVLWSYAFLITERKKGPRLALYFLFAISLLVIIMNQARADLLGVIVSLSVIFAISRQRKFMRYVFTPAFLLAAFLFVWALSKKIDVDYFGTHFMNSFLFRVQLDVDAARLICSDPWAFLIGFGQNNSIDNIRFFVTDIHHMPRLLPVHNFYLVEWSESGLVGVSLLACYLLHNYYHVMKNRRLIMAGHPAQQSLYYFVIGLGIFLAINAAISWVICVYEIRLLLVVLLSVSFVSLRRNIKIMQTRVC